MKNAFLTILIPVFCFGCTMPQYYHQRINNIPTRPNNFDVAIYLQGDAVPEEPYFEIVEFYLREKGKLSRKEILDKLEIEAIKEGVDAVIDVEVSSDIEDITNGFTVFVDLFDDDPETTYLSMTYTYLTGIGIKFLENLDYIHELPEYEYVYVIDEKTRFPTPFFKIEYTLTGQEHMVYPESDIALEVYQKYVQFYSDFHLIHQREGWVFYKNKEHRISRRVLPDENGDVAKVCLFTYDPNGRISEITIRDLRGVFVKEEYVKYHYNQAGKIQSKTIHLLRNSTIYEEYKYDEGRLKGREIKILITGKDNYLLSTTFTYYPKDYLEKYYKSQLANSGMD